MVSEHDEIESELGNIEVSKEHFERKRSNSDSWNHVHTEYESEDILDKIHFSEIEDLKYESQSVYSPVTIETEGLRGKVPFCNEEAAEDFFKLLRYRWMAWRQNYQ